jgi:alcohol dehydrogenase
MPNSTMMKALVFHGPDKIALEDRPKPTIQQPTDAIVRITATTICGTDLHIVKGDVPGVTDGTHPRARRRGHYRRGGKGCRKFHKGDKVLISLITSCGRCSFCKKGMYSHCLNGGWLLGNKIDGTQAEYVRIPLADTGLYALSPEIDDEAAVMLSCILPTGLECGALNGRVEAGGRRGDNRRRTGRPRHAAGRAPLLSREIIMVDLDDHRLEVARSLGATQVVNSADGKAAERIMALTKAAGVDVAIEAVGIPATFDICQAIIAPAGASPTWASTAKASSSISRGCGPPTSRSRRAWWTRARQRCCSRWSTRDAWTRRSSSAIVIRFQKCLRPMPPFGTPPRKARSR